MSETVRTLTRGIVLSFLAGAAPGAAVALLPAPQSGRDTRRKLKHVTDDLADRAARVPPALQAAYRRATEAGKEKGAIVVLDPATGDLLAAVSYPVLKTDQEDAHLDRARYGLYPPGSTFKIVTAMAALRKDAALTGQKYACIRLPDGRVGNFMRGSNRPIRDDVLDANPHGTLDMEHAVMV